MKNVLFALTAVALSFSALAQTKMPDTTHHISHTSTTTHKTTMHKMQKSTMGMDHCVMMKDGKMMTQMHGKTMPMKKTMTMTNGTMVMTNGSVKMKSGKTMMMKNGECMMMNGKMMDCKMPMKKGMKM